jgi:2-polyprenyl-6-methoxyphenol hydroxylase-like FAD-dependent oxidoreductase
VNPFGNEKLVVAGCGIAALSLALALANGRRRISLLEREAAPPEISPKESFELWERRGAAQMRHSHIFLGRLTSLLRTRYPALLGELLAAGARLCPFEEALPRPLRDRYLPAPGDEDLALLHCRRATFEYVVRRYVARLPGIEVICEAKVTGLIAERKGGRLIARGLEYERQGAAEKTHGDIVIDASGRNSRFPNWLRSEGITVAEENVPAGLLYLTRHYRIRPGRTRPSLGAANLGGDLGYLRYGICPADNDCFSITMAVPEGEVGLRRSVMKPDKFDALCMQIPACACWIDPDMAQPASAVLPMANLTNLWRTFLNQNQAQILGFFAIGDAAIRTNPIYGRGCSAGFIHAHLLEEVIEASHDPAERAVMLEERARVVLRPFFDSSVRQDSGFILRASQTGGPQAKPNLKARLKQSLTEHGLAAAMQGDLQIARASARAFHMIDAPVSWPRRPALLARIVRMWLAPKRRAQFHAPPLGPSRGEALALLAGPTSSQA